MHGQQNIKIVLCVSVSKHCSILTCLVTQLQCCMLGTT